MRNLRQHPRITDSRDLLASWRAIGSPRTVGRVINLSQGGMLVAGTQLKVGEVTGFELGGPNFRYTGVAKVAHTNGETTGLRFLCWHGQAERPVRTLIQNRSHKRHPVTTDSREREQSIVRRVAVLIGADTSPKR
jgi:hypothetical protein